MFNQRHYVESTLIQFSFTVLGRLSILLHKAVAFVKSGDGAGARKFQVPGRPSNVNKNRTMAYCVLAVSASGIAWMLFSRLSSLFFFPLAGTARYRLKYCLRGPSNQPIDHYSNNEI